MSSGSPEEVTGPLGRKSSSVRLIQWNLENMNHWSWEWVRARSNDNISVTSVEIRDSSAYYRTVNERETRGKRMVYRQLSDRRSQRAFFGWPMSKFSRPL